ncbi:hypothetical protein DCC39_00150 [Pueribacillus theae]|uniref:Metallo-beta-lactamase domain-containing protein n=1 Tax=Pueribacillus theae TaxID=2171751 RepID=A0A2U1K7H7_9BACI|nr:MBL fold metallo-hydrolase [Pueribacillus theae]PWA13342.1 hypothetical protein DCC39_00150 [Pueribacillus theae]
MKWKQMPVGPLQENTYVIWNDANQCLIVDPGSEGSKIIQYIETLNVTPLAILLTHAHFDHIGAVDEVREAFNIPVYIHANEEDWLEDPSKNGSIRFPLGVIKAKKAEHIIKNESQIEIGEFSIEIFETPGHSPGSVSFYFANEGVVFSGDALFQGSIGRTDLPFGNYEQLLNSIHQKLLSLPEETEVCPGHGPVTSIEAEMDSNPFLTGF